MNTRQSEALRARGATWGRGMLAAMRTRSDTAQRNRYREQGYLLIPEFLDTDELETWRSAVDAAVAKRRGKSLDGYPAGNRERHYHNVFLQMMLLSRTSNAVRSLIHDRALARLAAELAGVTGIQLWHDQALIKEPYANPTAFHRDVPFWSFDCRRAISFWIALDDADRDNGCLYFLPGSHRLTDYRMTGIGENVGEIFHLYPELQGIPPVAVPAKAGDCVFHNGMVVHGAGANLTTRYRRAMTCAYMPKGARFNGKRNILSEDYVSSLAIGDVLDNYDELPLLFESDAAR